MGGAAKRKALGLKFMVDSMIHHGISDKRGCEKVPFTELPAKVYGVAPEHY